MRFTRFSVRLGVYLLAALVLTVSPSAEAEKAFLKIAPTRAGSFIAALYQDLLGRSPTASEAKLLLSNSSRSAVAGILLQSAEFRTDEIGDLYHSLLGRDADSAGSAAFLAVLEAGGS